MDDDDQNLKVWIVTSRNGLAIALMGLAGCCGSADLVSVIKASLDEESSEQEERMEALVSFRDQIDSLIQKYRQKAKRDE